ncbi:condensin subunit ScpB [Pleomorphomonas diazotrophica]|nr:condensin subunit ScpB [Pleomorphomonas diazotrophica]
MSRSSLGDDAPHGQLRLFAGDRDPAEYEAWMAAIRGAEAILFASAQPVGADELAERLAPGTDVPQVLADLRTIYASRGVNLVEVAGKWMFRTAPDLAHLLTREQVEPKKLSRAALETLAIIAYHQPVTRAEIEEIRGVTTNKGTLDVLMETGWIRMRGRRRTPGRPLTYGTTEAFLVHFGLEAVTDLPGVDDLKAAGFLEGAVPPGFRVPVPNASDALMPDEDPLTELDFQDYAPLPPEE